MDKPRRAVQADELESARLAPSPAETTRGGGDGPFQHPLVIGAACADCDEEECDQQCEVCGDVFCLEHACKHDCTKPAPSMGYAAQAPAPESAQETCGVCCGSGDEGSFDGKKWFACAYPTRCAHATHRNCPDCGGTGKRPAEVKP